MCFEVDLDVPIADAAAFAEVTAKVIPEALEWAIANDEVENQGSRHSRTHSFSTLATPPTRPATGNRERSANERRSSPSPSASRWSVQARANGVCLPFLVSEHPGLSTCLVVVGFEVKAFTILQRCGH